MTNYRRRLQPSATRFPSARQVRRRGLARFYVCQHGGLWQVREIQPDYHRMIYAADDASGEPLRRCKAFWRALVREIFRNGVVFDVAYLAAQAAAPDRACILAETEHCTDAFIQ